MAGQQTLSPARSAYSEPALGSGHPCRLSVWPLGSQRRHPHLSEGPALSPGHLGLTSGSGWAHNLLKVPEPVGQGDLAASLLTARRGLSCVPQKDTLKS